MIVFEKVLIDILDRCACGLNVATESTHRISRAGPDNVTEQRDVIRAAVRSPEEQYRMESSAHLLVSGILLRVVECLGRVRESFFRGAAGVPFSPLGLPVNERRILWGSGLDQLRCTATFRPEHTRDSRLK
jgi:hypothetical protein